MSSLRVGNAPCSWGTLEFEETKGEPVPFGRMLDEPYAEAVKNKRHYEIAGSGGRS